MIMEEWRIIEQHPRYEVSTYGRVRNIRNKKHLYIKSHTSGYKQVIIQYNGKKNYLYIHRLVAEAFIPNPLNLPYINHKDENKANNHISNLEWCTPKYNANYGTAKQKMGMAHRKKVRQYTKDGVFIKEWNGYQEAEETLGIAAGDISKYVNSKFHWVAVD